MERAIIDTLRRQLDALAADKAAGDREGALMVVLDTRRTALSGAAAQRTREANPDWVAFVLQHTFSALRHDPDGMTVRLSAGGMPLGVSAPWDAVLAMYDERTRGPYRRRTRPPVTPTVDVGVPRPRVDVEPGVPVNDVGGTVVRLADFRGKRT